MFSLCRTVLLVGRACSHEYSRKNKQPPPAKVAIIVLYVETVQCIHGGAWNVARCICFWRQVCQMLTSRDENFTEHTCGWTENGERKCMCRYSWHSAGSLGWPFPTLKYEYIFFQINYTEAISWNSTRKLLWFEIAKCWLQFERKILLCHLL